MCAYCGVYFCAHIVAFVFVTFSAITCKKGGGKRRPARGVTGHSNKSKCGGPIAPLRLPPAMVKTQLCRLCRLFSLLAMWLWASTQETGRSGIFSADNLSFDCQHGPFPTFSADENDCEIPWVFISLFRDILHRPTRRSCREHSAPLSSPGWSVDDIGAHGPVTFPSATAPRPRPRGIVRSCPT